MTVKEREKAMHKVVYNACYGGFGLSLKGIEWLAEHTTDLELKNYLEEKLIEERNSFIGAALALWPHIKNVYKKHYNDLVTDRLLNTIQYELSQLYKTATMYVLDEYIGIFNLAFKSCIHAAKRWDFDLEE